MPRYFFHLSDHVECDTTGVELPDAVAARREAISFLGATLRDEPDLIWDGQELRVQVVEETKGVACTVVVLAVDCASDLVSGTT